MQSIKTNFTVKTRCPFHPFPEQEWTYLAVTVLHSSFSEEEEVMVEDEVRVEEEEEEEEEEGVTVVEAAATSGGRLASTAPVEAGLRGAAAAAATREDRSYSGVCFPSGGMFPKRLRSGGPSPAWGARG